MKSRKIIVIRQRDFIIMEQIVLEYCHIFMETKVEATHNPIGRRPDGGSEVRDSRNVLNLK